MSSSTAVITKGVRSRTQPAANQPPRACFNVIMPPARAETGISSRPMPHLAPPTIPALLRRRRGRRIHRSVTRFSRRWRRRSGDLRPEGLVHRRSFSRIQKSVTVFIETLEHDFPRDLGPVLFAVFLGG